MNEEEQVEKKENEEEDEEEEEGMALDIIQIVVFCALMALTLVSIATYIIDAKLIIRLVVYIVIVMLVVALLLINIKEKNRMLIKACALLLFVWILNSKGIGIF